MNSDLNQRLMTAAGQGNLRQVKALSSRADINYADCINRFTTRSVLGEAALCGHLEIVKYLVEQGANPYMPYDKDPHPQKITKRKNIADYLLAVMKSPRILNRIDKDGYTPLGFCIRYRNCHKKAQELIELGADVCKMDNHGKRPLSYAVEVNSVALVNKLLEKGADISKLSALECALDVSSNAIGKILLERYPDLTNADLSDGSTPLTRSITNHNEEMAKYLIENGANVTQIDKNGKAPLDKALQEHLIDTAEILFLNCKTSSLTWKISVKLLNQLVEDGKTEIYKFLIKNNWDKEESNEHGKTSLALSAKHQHLILTKFLIENGADLDKATTEIEDFRKHDIDFDYFMKEFFSRKKEEEEHISSDGLTGDGHE